MEAASNIAEKRNKKNMTKESKSVVKDESRKLAKIKKKTNLSRGNSQGRLENEYVRLGVGRSTVAPKKR